MGSDDLLLSRAVLRITPHDAARGVNATYLLHQAIAELFGQYDKRPYLYRVDARHHDAHVVLILSTRQPTTPAAPSTSGVTLQELAIKPFSIRVARGTKLDFEIRVNASKDVPVEVGKRSRRVDVWEAVWRADRQTDATPHEVYGAYLRRRLQPAANVHDARVTTRGLVRARADVKGTRGITHVATNVIGTLDVIDTNALTMIVQRGIGRSRAFGCGLLCLSRPGTVLPRRHSISTPESAT